jgi:dTDP-glucose pyrophosphorylase
VLIADVSSCAVPTAATMKDVVENLTVSGLRLCLVVDGAGKLVGIVSDGDIRRGLLAGKGLDDPIVDVMNGNFVSASGAQGLAELGTLARARELTHIPIVDERGMATGLFIDQVEEKHNAFLQNTVVIMAGGMGLRLRPLTETTPKPMLSVAGKPMMQHTIEALKAEGLRNFVLSLNYLGEQIEQHFGDGSTFGVDITYVREKEPLGTAGSLSLLDQTFSDPIVVVNGDVLLSAKISDMLRYHTSHNAEITVGVKVLDTQIPFGVVNLDGSRITGISEKPVYRDFVNAGVYVLAPQVLEDVAPGVRLDMPELVAGRLSQQAVYAFPLHESWRDLGHMEDLENARRDYESKDD